MSDMPKEIEAIDIVFAYESTVSSTNRLLKSFRGARKLGLNFCRLDAEFSQDNINHSVAVFLLSLCHEEIVDKFMIGCPAFKSIIKEALGRSVKFSEDVESLLLIMPKGTWT
jgi:hypothetical protein